jgi:prevent-host-death family protein
MRTVTRSEVERNLSSVLETATREPVRIEQGGQDVVIVSAAEFEEAQQLLHKERIRRLQELMERAGAEAKANGFTEDLLPDLLKD